MPARSPRRASSRRTLRASFRRRWRRPCCRSATTSIRHAFAQQPFGRLHRPRGRGRAAIPNGWILRGYCSSTLQSMPRRRSDLAALRGRRTRWCIFARASLRSFWTQVFPLSAAATARPMSRKRHAIRYATYFVALPLLLGHAWFGFFRTLAGLGGFAGGRRALCRRPWQRLRVLGAALTPGQRLATEPRCVPGDPRHRRPGEDGRLSRRAGVAAATARCHSRLAQRPGKGE